MSWGGWSVDAAGPDAELVAAGLGGDDCVASVVAVVVVAAVVGAEF